MYVHALTAILLTILAKSSGSEETLARGWGEDVKWYNFEDGLAVSSSQGKPLMLVIHKTWCGACKALKPKLAGSSAFSDLSEKFVMVNTQDDEEPKESQFAPDGGYIPRILFLDSQGNVMTSVYNKGGSDKYKYYYSNPSDIINSMNEVLKSSFIDKVEL